MLNYSIALLENVICSARGLALDDGQKKNVADMTHAVAVLKVAGEIAQEADYDPGLLNDYGGGNVGWWQDYIRYEVDRCNAYWRGRIEALPDAE